ncbi:MAG: PD40 domain-containing protein [Candidatus Riflebacteria bacterium]|nr:PD40 domain-containing protein [Candidatus Riflebacteria bacterium]
MKRNLILLFTLLLIVSPAFSQKKAIFTGEKGGKSDIMILDLESMKVAPLIETEYSEKQPSVSPDGEKLLFVANKVGIFTVYQVPLKNSNASWTEVGAGAGEYSWPSYSPDGKSIAAVYSPDLDKGISSMSLVILDPVARRQEVIFVPPFSDNLTTIISRPLWVDNRTLAFCLVEYSDYDIAPRIQSGSLYAIHLDDKKAMRLAGGTSGFNESGSPEGFKASQATFSAGRIFFASVSGSVDRNPMTIDPEGKNISPLKELALEEFYGPIFPVGENYLLGLRDSEGVMTIGLFETKSKTLKKINFQGMALDLNIIP